MGFRLLDHTADVAIEGAGGSLGEAFAAVADGLAAAQCDDIPAEGERFRVGVDAEGREALLFDYLDRLIYERDVRNVLPAENEATVTEIEAGWRLEGSTRGVPLEAVSAREIKAVTYSDMVIEEVADGWRAYVVFDV